MANRPVIFISATSDLRSARDLVGKVLYSMGYEPVWQDIEPTDGGELLEVLRRRIAPCVMMVQLVGQRYGAEPPQPTAEFGRISYTQFETLEAERVGRKVIYHFLDESFPTDPAAAERPELASLQTAYRQRLKDANRLRHGGIASATDLELSIRRLSDDLAALRRKAERRHRNQVWLSLAAVAGVVAAAVLSVVVMNRQGRMAATVERQTEIATTVDAKIDKQAAEMAALREAVAAARKEVASAVSPKTPAAGQTQPEPIPPKILAKAQLLEQHGNPEDRVLGLIARKQHAEADRIIQELKSKASSIDEVFRLLTLEGDNWYQAGEPDGAIAPYEKAMALKADDFAAQNNLVLALDFARLGNVALHRQRAIQVAEETLHLVPAGSTHWASVQNNLGNAWWNLPTGDKAENLTKAIAAYEKVLTVRTKEAYPAEWATTQNNLGVAWSDFPTGNRSENLKKAIAACEKALTVYTKKAYPTDWAMTQNTLGSAWLYLPTGDKAENLSKAITAYENALTVYTKEAHPADWARTQHNLGLAWQTLPTGDKAENLTKAITAFEKALAVFTKEAYPAEWAMTQNKLGGALWRLRTGDKADNVKKAIAADERALTVYTKEAYPTGWAMTQTNLGNAWSELPSGDKAENLTKAITAYEKALTVYTKEAYPAHWATTQNNLGIAWCEFPKGNSSENLKKAIAAYEAALAVRTKEAYPAESAWTQNALKDAKERLRNETAGR
jgi:hypothetical protein